MPLHVIRDLLSDFKDGHRYLLILLRFECLLLVFFSTATPNLGECRMEEPLGVAGFILVRVQQIY